MEGNQRLSLALAPSLVFGRGLGQEAAPTSEAVTGTWLMPLLTEFHERAVSMQANKG